MNNLNTNTIYNKPTQFELEQMNQGLNEDWRMLIDAIDNSDSDTTGTEKYDNVTVIKRNGLEFTWYHFICNETGKCLETCKVDLVTEEMKKELDRQSEELLDEALFDESFNMISLDIVEAIENAPCDTDDDETLQLL